MLVDEVRIREVIGFWRCGVDAYIVVVRVVRVVKMAREETTRRIPTIFKRM